MDFFESKRLQYFGPNYNLKKKKEIQGIGSNYNL